MSRKELEYYWNFATMGPQVFGTSASPAESKWVKKLTGSCTVGGVVGGAALALDATSEAQNACMYWTDVLDIDIDDLISVEINAALSVALGATGVCVFGMGSARNDTADSVAAHAWFRLDGSTSVKVESDDGTNDKDDIATGQTLATVKKRFYIDFLNGQGTHSPPTRGVGGKGNVLFSMSKGPNQALAPVARGTKFDMSNYSSGLQPIFQVSKTSTDLGTLLVEDIRIKYRSRP